MNPSDAHSSLAALRQLKEMLDAGTITPAEFETLKRQIVFGQEPALPLDTPASVPQETAPSPAAPVPPLASAGAEPLLPPLPSATSPPDFLPLASPVAEPDWLAAPAPGLPLGQEEAETPAEERRNPLNLIFAIGGLLVFLGVIAYLMIGRPATPDEHLTSGTQTAADSVAVVPEVGPQAEQLNLPPAAAPETIRVAPVTQPVPTQAAGQFRTDSVAAPVAAPPAAKAPTATPAASTTAVTDSSSITKMP